MGHATLWEPQADESHREIAPGAVWLRGFLTVDEQQRLITESFAFLNSPAGGYVPVVRGGGLMHVRMVCLGRHWNAMTYQYGPTRADFDNQPVQPLPDSWRDLAARAARAAGFEVEPGICIINSYESDGRMGLHQDKDESPGSIAAGVPVVSLSIGDTARFLFGGLKRRDEVQPLMLESGDAFIFGGPARLRYHGVSRILPGTAAAPLAISGRLNLTFRQY